MSNQKTTFLHPDFDKNIPNKVNHKIQVESKDTLTMSETWLVASAISRNSFPSNVDGVYVFATKIDNIGKTENLFFGFSDVATFDSTKSSVPGSGMSGTCFRACDGLRWPGLVSCLSENVKNAKEIISIFIISNNGKKKEVQWIVDGNESQVHNCTNDFKNRVEIFPCISFYEKDQQVQTISFDQVKSRSPIIDGLMKEFSKQQNKTNIPISLSAPSTSTAQNDVVISQLRDQVSRSQDALIQEKNEAIKILQQQLAS